MPGFYWWRTWHGAPMDHKWSVIAARAGIKTGIVSAVAWALMDYASQQPTRGDVGGFDTEEYAVYSGFCEEEITATITAMTEKGIITNGHLTNWEKRQPKREDDSNARVREWREKKRNVTQSNAEDGKETIDSVSASVSVDLSINDGDFGKMQSICERLTGCVATSGDIATIKLFVDREIIEEDIAGGISWLSNKNRVIHNISQLEGPTMTQYKKRIQVLSAAAADNWHPAETNS